MLSFVKINKCQSSIELPESILPGERGLAVIQQQILSGASVKHPFHLTFVKPELPHRYKE